MTELLERIGIPMFIQITIESWNELFLLLLIIAMQVGKFKDKSDELANKVKIPLTSELVIFYSAVFLYNFANIITIIYGGHDSAAAYYIMRIGVFCYYLIGAFQTVFFLEVIKTYIAKENHDKRLERVIIGFQLLEVPNLLLLLITPSVKALYFLDANNEYNRLWGYYLWQGITIITFAFIGAVVFFYRKKTDRFINRIIAVAFVFPMLGFLISIVSAPFNFNNIMVSVSELLIFMLYEKNKTDVTIRSVYELEQSKRELEQSKVRLLVAQIQPHFIFNCLATIQALCYVDSKSAADSINVFGDYLRANIDSISSDDFISFSSEMKHVEQYVKLERISTDISINVIYELEIQDFMIPPLTIQPIVENAIKHGALTRRDGSGMVKIRTEEIEDKIRITITDNGKGASLTKKQKEHQSVGIQNVSQRLALKCSGTLKQKISENGAVSVIEIPRITEKEK